MPTRVRKYMAYHVRIILFSQEGPGVHYRLDRQQQSQLIPDEKVKK